MKILVTGQNGFVGTYFTNYVGSSNVVAFPSSIDLVDFEKTREFVASQNFDAVLHLAARSSVSQSFDNPTLTSDVNVGGTRNLLRALQEKNFSGRALLVSSGEVYGAVPEKDLPVGETAGTAPRNPYAESKVAMENLVRPGGEFAKTSFTALIARPFNHIGPGQADHFVVANFTLQLAKRKAGIESGAMKTGNLSVTRDFTDVRDIVAGYAKLLKNEKTTTGEIYNLGSGVETKLQTILDTLIELSGTGTRYEVDPSRLRPDEQTRMCADVSKIRDRIDWKPKYALKETLGDCFNAALERIAT